jgi:uncharacterized protein (DUF2236 family)
LAPLFGIPEGYLPASRAELAAYLQEMQASGQIAVTDTARRLAREELNPPVLRRVPPLLWLLQLPAIGLLPPALRAAYGFPWMGRHEAALRTLSWASRAVLPLVPAALRYWPAARRAMARGRT